MPHANETIEEFQSRAFLNCPGEEMEFQVHEFKIKRKNFKNCNLWRANFWQDVEEKQKGLPEACGCYLYTTKHGGTQTPWYVGKAEKQSFKKRALQHPKLISELFQKRRSIYLLLLPSLTKGGGFRKPRATKSISHLEAMLIGIALQNNKRLRNVSLARMLGAMYVPGVVNKRRGRYSTATQSLRRTLGF